MIADLHVCVRPDCLVADVPATHAAALAEAFERLIFAEDLRIGDQSQSIGQFSVVGGGAAHVLSRALGVADQAVRGLSLWSQFDIDGGFVARWRSGTCNPRRRRWDAG